ncbi:MAG TPA: molybdopterin-dependent oxidoreductase [Noviherbaspirillum sp.]
MDKRTFLAAAAGTAALPALAGASSLSGSTRTPALLTVSGKIGRGNRGPLDPALDQMMKKHGVSFDKAHAFDFATIAALPTVTIRPTLEYDAKVHTLRGPLLLDVVKAAGARFSGSGKLLLRAVDGYAVPLSLADARAYRFIVATHLDGNAMPLGGLGPLWAVLEADRFPDIASRPLNERYAQCPWGLYHIEVQ